MAARRRLEAGALMLPIFGALLYVPPLLGVFNLAVAPFGIPLIAIYMFAVWVGLIAATFALARHLGRSGGEDDEANEDAPR